MKRFKHRQSRVLPGVLILLFGWCAFAQGARHAMIVSVRAGTQEQMGKNRTYCQQTQALLESVGFDQIHLFFEGGDSALKGSEEITGEAILEQLAETARVLEPTDEFWLILYGYSSSNSRGVTLATKGQRLRGTQVLEALDEIRAPQCVLALTQGSAAWMKLLCTRSDRKVFTATSSAGQMNPPLLPEHLLSVWAEQLTLDCPKVFNLAAKKNEEEYANQNLAVAEIPQMFDGEAISVYPFKEDSSQSWALGGVGLSHAPETVIVSAQTEEKAPTLAKAGIGAIDFSEFEDLLTKEDREELQPATSETIQMISEAAEASLQYEGFPSFFPQLEQRFMVQIDADFLSEKRSQIYLLNDLGAEQYRLITLQDCPPAQVVEVQTARVVYPDGRFINLEDDIVKDRSRGSRYHHLKVPAAHAGCLIELVVKQAQGFAATVHHNLSLQQTVPVASARVILDTPSENRVFYKLYGMETEPAETKGDYGRTLTFELGEMSALEPLPYDPPFNDFAVRMVLTSLPSWAEFREWVDQIMRGSDEVDDVTATHAATLTQEAKGDTEKVKALYEFLCDLRYETTPIGARALRPRLPGEVCSSRYGDCKDKANALVAMARSLGIPGYVALVNRSSTTDETFPSWQFNHAVAYFPELPGFPEGLWCDATDGSTPFASLPPGDMGRAAFLLKPGEGVFRTIELADQTVNTLEQDWELNCSSSGKVRGILEISAKGLSDYYLRGRLKRSSPQQVLYIAQHLVNEHTTGLSVEEVVTTELSDLTTPLQITVRCFGSDWELTRNGWEAPYDLWDAVAVPHRDRALLLNDGQPLVVTQRIRVEGDARRPPAWGWEKRTETALLSVDFSTEGTAWERRSRVELLTPYISSEMYPDFQMQVLEWGRALTHHLTNKKASNERKTLR